jgi:hypothetical protein
MNMMAYSLYRGCYARVPHVLIVSAATVQGSACREDVQCTSLGDSAICDEGECHCSRDAVAVNGTCRKKKCETFDIRERQKEHV